MSQRTGEASLFPTMLERLPTAPSVASARPFWSLVCYQCKLEVDLVSRCNREPICWGSSWAVASSTSARPITRSYVSLSPPNRYQRIVSGHSLPFFDFHQNPCNSSRRSYVETMALYEQDLAAPWDRSLANYIVTLGSQPRASQGSLSLLLALGLGHALQMFSSTSCLRRCWRRSRRLLETVVSLLNWDGVESAAWTWIRRMKTAQRMFWKLLGPMIWPYSFNTKIPISLSPTFKKAARLWSTHAWGTDWNLTLPDKRRKLYSLYVAKERYMPGANGLQKSVGYSLFQIVT